MDNATSETETAMRDLLAEIQLVIQRFVDFHDLKVASSASAGPKCDEGVKPSESAEPSRVSTSAPGERKRDESPVRAPVTDCTETVRAALPEQEPELLHVPSNKTPKYIFDRGVSISWDHDVSEKVSSESESGFEVLSGWKICDASAAPRISRRNSLTPLAWKGKRAWEEFGWCKAISQSWRCVWFTVAMAVVAAECIALPLRAFRTDSLHWEIIGVLRILFWSMTLVLELQSCRQRFLGILLELVALAAAFAEVLENAADSRQLMQLAGIQSLRAANLPRYWKLSGLSRCFRRTTQTRRGLRVLLNVVVPTAACGLGVHWLACSWYAVGIVELPEEAPMFEKYQTAFTWAVSRLHPLNTSENMQLESFEQRALALLGTGIGVLAGAIFTSVITNDISDLRRVQRSQREQDNQLEDYLSTFPVPWDLEVELKEFMRKQRAWQHPPEKEALAGILPTFLFKELCREALAPVMKKHSLFGGLGSKFPAFEFDLCLTGLTDWHVAPGETLFSQGSKCNHMVIAAVGTVTYELSDTAADSVQGIVPVPHRRSWSVVKVKENLQRQVIVGQGDWLCEGCLWTSWYYLGKAGATSSATLLCLSHDHLLQLGLLHKEAFRQLQSYARSYVKALNNLQDQELSDLPFAVQGIHDL
ncbi:unnamed protein product [Effrenium voratum]|uniref:Cyclic nucleotide-binding domain-containing protein n=1 Tax=Effrenium voratum TaxID=2562239 RepID=A0AA36IYD2_9DINO|nr:unnamed protein product [Effrenium voratum]